MPTIKDVHVFLNTSEEAQALPGAETARDNAKPS